MNFEFKLPVLGENIASGDVVNVLVHEGDTIKANDGVVELETDKAVVEIPCPRGGKIDKVLIKKGDTVKVGQVLISLVEGAEGASTASAAKPAGNSAAATSAATKAAAPVATKAAPAAAVVEHVGPIPAGPAARRMARELGVDLRHTAGSGRNGRITLEDIQAQSVEAPAARSPAPSTPMPVPRSGNSAAPAGLQPVVPPGDQSQDSYGPVRKEKINRTRRTIAEQMVRSVSTIPHVTNFDDADVTELDRLRQGVAAGQLGDNVKLTMMPFVMKAVAMVLRRHPLINATIDTTMIDKGGDGQIIYKEYVNLGVAIDTPRGLLVPNIRNADRLTILQLAQALASLSERARAVQLGLEDLRGGTFTISNLGAVGGAYSTPIINHPEVAILLLGRARWLPVVRGDNHDRIEPRLMMPLSLSYDHRLVDGATASRFLNEVIRNLVTPGMLLLA
jgi:pyruvate/2-oxoglutarate dehydrogenase complex dihydrolipoamide acyltransferase (E2) component